MYNKQFSWPLKSDNTSPWAYQIGYFTDSECDEILHRGQDLPRSGGVIGKDQQIDYSVRKSQVSFFASDNSEHHWIFNRVMTAVNTFNQQFWNYDLTAIECLQFTQYTEVGDYYASHMDLSLNSFSIRKLSISIQLSAPETYTGSELMMLRYGDEYDRAPLQRGSIIVFPSYHVHKVNPLLSGTRYSLVGWVLGPPFR